ncbi:glycoside hydrolase family 32 protein [Streptomyces sp. NP160]|uniref:glycoside hydrolase family 32 protein n=1 Tax=Streptomyces sp. NP160 TaxID=2586637 RepID=UPI0015D5928F|nr:glycoside hydrolase family 32 protein [Streptomyces sp. NP160]
MTRPLLHLTPTTGWMNDPNGLTQSGGVHHVFFQHNPDAPTFGTMRWGHATSPDLVHWTEHPTALSPRAGGPDAGGCWSGCAVDVAGGSAAVIYTGVQRPEDGGPQRAVALRAVSEDASLVSWQPDAEAVIADWPELDPPLTDWRDHAVLRPGDLDGQLGWRQVVAAGTAGHDGAGKLLSYTTTDPELRDWAYEGVFLDAAAAGLDAHVFECPDVFAPVGDGPGQLDGADLVVVLSWYSKDPAAELHHSSGAVWLTGRLASEEDGAPARFVPERRGALDLGSRFYAPQSYTTADRDRRIAFGWLRTQDDPASAGRTSVGAQSLPRHWRVVGGRLQQAPVAEVSGLAGDVVVETDELSGAGVLDEPAQAVVVHLAVDDARALAASTLVLVSPEGRRTVVDLSAFGRPTTERLVDGAWTPEETRVRWADVYVDTGIVEVFASDGRAAATSDLAVSAVAAVEATGPARASVRVLTP